MHDDEHELLLQRLRTNDTTLTTLDLECSGLGEVGIAAVADALERNTTLTTLEFAACNDPDSVMDRIRMLLSGRVVADQSVGEVLCSVKPAVVAPPRGTKRTLSD